MAVPQSIDWLEECHGDGPTRSLGVLLDLGCLSQHDIVPGCVALAAKQFARRGSERLGSNL
jgi:hypothetical protein